MNWWKSNFKTSRSALWLIATTALILVLFSAFKQGRQYSVITSDGIGYYSYLTHVFETNTLSSQVPDNRFILDFEGKGVNKYYVGTAISMSPFYAIGKFFSSAGNTSFSLSYQLAISLSGIVYLMLGLVLIQKLLRLFHFSETVISKTLLLLFFGTNLLVYSVFQPSMSHVYSFCWVAAFLFFTKKYALSVKSKYLYASVACLALVILIRPINGIVVFLIPFLVGSWLGTKLYLLSFFSKYRVVFTILIFLLISSVQPLMWYLQSGNWIVWSYSEEGFYFTSPHLLDFLFSFRKGVFIYTPMLLFSLLGGLLWVKKNKFQGIGILLFFSGVIYVLSSWWNWYYGPSFGQRPLVDFYSVSAVLMAFSVQQFLGSRQQYSALFLGIIFVLLNLVQTFQFQKGIISSWDMNWDKYQYSFLKVRSKHKNTLGGNNDIMLYHANINNLLKVGFDFETAEAGSYQYNENEFGWEYSLDVNSDFITHRGIYVKVNVDVFSQELSHKNEALFVLEIQDSTGKNYHYYTFPIRSTPPTKIGWKTESYQIEAPRIRSSNDRIKVYIWNKGKEKYLIDNLQLDILGIN